MFFSKLAESNGIALQRLYLDSSLDDAQSLLNQLLLQQNELLKQQMSQSPKSPKVNDVVNEKATIIKSDTNNNFKFQKDSTQNQFGRPLF